MDRYGRGGSIQNSSKLEDLTPFGSNPTGDALFDASQYEFFGGDMVEEVDLGGLEDEDDDLGSAGFEGEEFQLDKKELNKVASGSSSAGVGRDWGSRESSSASELAQNADFSNWFNQRAFDAEAIHESRKWSSHPYSSSACFMEPDSLHRASSYPEQHSQQKQNVRHQRSSEPILIPNSPFTSYPPPGGRSQQASPSDQSNISYYPQIPGSSHPNSHLQMNGSPHGSRFGGSLPHGLPFTSQIQNRWANQTTSLYPGNQSGYPSNFLPRQNGFPQMMPPQQTRMPHPFQLPVGHFQAKLLNPHLSPSPPNSDLLRLPDLRDQRLRSTRYPHYGSDRPKFKSKYMTADELENIYRMQLAATHSNDPYAEDYYHQATLARKSVGAKLRHHFCPINLRENSSKTHSTNEPHAFLQVDALGRVSFSSIRRPRPLLEVNPQNLSNNADSKPFEKPLGQEPMLAARVIIEDGINLLLDVDDIDRFLRFNQLPDGGAQFRQRKHVLLEGLASSLQLVDPLGKNGQSVDLAPKDDLVFVRLVSLPKGIKLLLRYLELLSPGELSRVVCMAVCRNLRFLFRIIQPHHEISTVTGNLSKAVSSRVHRMELKSLAACLASAVCSSEHPPLRPIGHAAGDGASVVLKSLLERATELLTDPHAADNCSADHRVFWQASFDAFFGLLTKYCFGKYDSIVQSLTSQGSIDMTGVGSDVAKAISREMPVELLRASLPHTSEQQRKLLLEFAQRTMPVTGF